MSDNISFDCDRRKGNRRIDQETFPRVNMRLGNDRRSKRFDIFTRSDRRSFIHILINADLIVYSSNQIYHGKAIDISEKGLKAIFKEKIADDETFKLEIRDFENSGIADTILVEGYIIRTNDKTFEFEVTFNFKEDNFFKMRQFCLDVLFKVKKKNEFYDSFRKVKEGINKWNERYTYFRQIDLHKGTNIVSKQQNLIMLSSNDYLGLTNHPKVKEAAIKAVERYGTGTGSTTVLSGTLDLHKVLENKLAEFKGMEAALLFGTGFMANTGVISTLFQKDFVLLNDENNHISIFEGCRFSKSRVRIFKHNDMDSLEKSLKIYSHDRKKVIIVESVYSMDGDLADLVEIVRLGKKYNAVIVVDEAHASGVLGFKGRGGLNHFNVEGKIDIVTDSLGKAFASMGGYVAGSRELIDYLKHFSTTAIFTTSLPATTCATVIAALEVMATEESLYQKLFDNLRFLRNELISSGFNIGQSNSHIIPIIVGDEALAFRFSTELQQKGVFITSVGRPAVKRGKARLRIAPMATHTNDEIERALNAIKNVGRNLKVIC